MPRTPLTHGLALGLMALCGLAQPAAAAVEPPDPLRLNQIQVIGTHNSYHAGLTPGIAALLRQKNPKAADELDYSHPSLTRQLDGGVRQLELDIYADSQGGRFAHPFGAAMAGKDAPPFDPDGVMRRPGLKVLHLQDIDYVSTCQPFVGCLSEIRAWSLAHPGHAPLFILVETKTQPPIPGVPMVAPEPFTATALDALDDEIRSVFPREALLLPDDVRGAWPTLRESVLHGGWPTLAAARGKVVFLLDQTNVTATYTAGHPSLRGRVLFTNADPAAPDAAFVERNDGPAAEIADLVRQGFLVRTRADSDTHEGRTGETLRRDGALASGAQLVSTDYPAAEPARWTGYSVALPGGGALRCNPVNAPATCREAGK